METFFSILETTDYLFTTYVSHFLFPRAVFPFTSIICLDYIVANMKYNTFHLRLLYASVAVALLFEVIQAVPPPQNGSIWEPVLDLTDNFDGAGLNFSKWSNDNTGRGLWKGRLPSLFQTDNAWVENGTLRLRNTLTDKYSDLDDAELELGHEKALTEHWVDAAKVYSLKKIAQPGMYFETSMQSSDTAMSSSFWFRMSSFSEIDVIEQIGHASKSDAIAEEKAHEYAANTHVFGKYDGSGNPIKHVMVTFPCFALLSHLCSWPFCPAGQTWL